MMAVGLRDAQIDRQVSSAGESHGMLGCDAAAPFRVRQAIDAQLPAKTAAIECDDICAERSEVSLTCDDAGFDVECARLRLLEPEVDASQIARRHRAEGKRRARRR